MGEAQRKGESQRGEYVIQREWAAADTAERCRKMRTELWLLLLEGHWRSWPVQSRGNCRQRVGGVRKRGDLSQAGSDSL